MVSLGAKSNYLQLIVTLLMLGALLAPRHAVSAPSQTKAVSQEQGKVILIRKILGHVRWPNDRDLKTLVLGYYGDDPAMVQALVQSFSSTKVRGKKIKIVQLAKMKAVRNVQVVIIDEKFNTRLAAIARLTKGTGTLMISD